MALKNAKRSLDGISRSLARTHDDREFLLRNTREIVVLCGKSIVAVHGADLAGAKAGLAEAGRLLARYRKRSGGDLSRYLITPEQEYTEAAALIAIAENRQIPSRDALKVSGEAYVLGLMDCVGELKRLVLDRIRGGDTAGALAAFGVMEDLFSLLYPFAGLDKVVKDARRKLDVDRMLVEDTRTVITQEIRRAELVEAIKGMER